MLQFQDVKQTWNKLNEDKNVSALNAITLSWNNFKIKKKVDKHGPRSYIVPLENSETVESWNKSQRSFVECFIDSMNKFNFTKWLLPSS